MTLSTLKGTAGGITVNVNVTTSPANQNTHAKLSGNAIGTTNEKNSTPCISDMNNGVSFTNNTKNSNINSYNSMKKKIQAACIEDIQ
eukprot:11473880-Ditylum_brightwellii.AAC.1